jgi:protein phosphatase
LNIKLPKLAFVALVGTSGSGKTTFARKHFLPTEVLSSDTCRGWVSDDENSQSATTDAFDVLYYIASKRLAVGKLTVVDATNVQKESRAKIVTLARQFHVLPVAIVLDLPEKICQQRNQSREDRQFGAHVIRNQRSQLRRSIRGLRKEGFRQIYVLKSVEEVEAVSVEREPLWNDKTHLRGPFDFIGDIHNCCDELELLLKKLGYQLEPVKAENGWPTLNYRHPERRTAVFVGDIVDRGPRAVDSLALVRNMVLSGNALCVPGNHDAKLLRKLRGKDVKIRHGLAETLEDLERVPDEHKAEFNKQLIKFLDSLISHYVLDDGKIVVAHAGMPESMQGRGSGKVRSFALYGETTGEIDEFGLPVRHNWAAEYRGKSMVVYGHTPVPEAEWVNQTIDIDTGCVFGGKMTALRYPELELVSVPAARVYCEPAKPLEANATGLLLSAQHANDDMLDAEDVLGKRIISTELMGNVTVREQNGTAALEVISRFAANPKWLIYLPPTMSPAEASEVSGFLEHPKEAFQYFSKQKVSRVVSQRKHMGSRAIVTVCKDVESARERFGITNGEGGIIYTRTGRRFFSDSEIEDQLLERVRQRLTDAGFWDSFDTSWVCLDCELMPWSEKAKELLKNQYAAVGAAASHALPKVLHTLKQAAGRLDGADSDAATGLSNRFTETRSNVGLFVEAYRAYCWDVNSLDDWKLAPFHLLATEGADHFDKDHLWHMEKITSFCGEQDDNSLLFRTDYQVVDLADESAVESATQWWLELTAAGGEGMVVKPVEFISKRPRGLVQPAIKCRGKEYLRIIYGPDYDREVNLQKLRRRSVGKKRGLALREFALGVESVRRFVQMKPLRQTHECVFGVLAMESEPVDPRL